MSDPKLLGEKKRINDRSYDWERRKSGLSWIGKSHVFFFQIQTDDVTSLPDITCSQNFSSQHQPSNKTSLYIRITFKETKLSKMNQGKPHNQYIILTKLPPPLPRVRKHVLNSQRFSFRWWKQISFNLMSLRFWFQVSYEMEEGGGH